MIRFLSQLAYALVLLGGLLLADPFKLSPIRGINFTPSNYSSLPAPSNVELSDSQDLLVKATLVEGGFFGPESIAFDPAGEGPYLSLSDGRVVKLEESGWATFAVTSPNRTEACDYKKLGPNLPIEHICGRPLGLQFHPVTGDLYVADAYHGLFVVEKKTRRVQCLATEAEGVPFGFTNAMDVLEDGTVYFTDSSTKYRRRQFLLEILEGQPYGRLLKYDPTTNVTTVLVRDLLFPNGVAISKDRSFLVFAETSLLRLHRYWLTGPKAGTSEVFAELPGWPDNVKLNPRGRFWVGIHARRNPLIDWAAKRPWVRTAILKLPLSIKLVYILAIRMPHGIIMELDEHGNVTQILEDRKGVKVRAVSEVEEHDGFLLMGSVIMPHIAVYDLKNLQQA